MPKVLYSSEEVRQAIQEIFASPNRRRVAIAAFVGEGASAYLPRPEGLELVCWPKAGGTNPDGLRELMSRGVDIWFVDSLHMKVYWAEGKGAVVTSANLSTGALGSGNLRELGVRLQPGELNIDRILKSLDRRRATQQELNRLDRLHTDYLKRHPEAIKHRGAGRQSFGEWYQSPFRRQWKIGWVDRHAEFCREAKTKAREEYQLKAPYTMIGARKGDYSEHDWVLTFRLEGDRVWEFNWKSIDFVVHVSRAEKKAFDRGYPFQAVQVHPPIRYPPPPFKIDRPFITAFKQAVVDYGGSRIRRLKNLKPSARFLQSIHRHLP